jgi:hypothetical protein
MSIQLESRSNVVDHIDPTPRPSRTLEALTVAPPIDSLTQSIYESYNAFNEVKYLQNELSSLSEEERAYYLRENILSYIEEFAGEIRIKKIKGIITESGRMDILGSDIAEMCRKTSREKGSDSREAMEGAGIEKILQGILEGNNRAVWVSPPKVAAYGFALTFMVDDYDPVLKGRPFRELLLRYPEEMDSIETSRTVYRQLTDRVGIEAADSNQFRDYADFLAHPLIYQYDQGYEDMDSLYEFLDISPADIQYSEEFRKQVFPEIRPYFDEYIALVEAMSGFDLSRPSAEFNQMEQAANVLIGAMFNIGRIVQRKLSGRAEDQDMMTRDEVQLQSYKIVSPDREILYYSASQMSNYEKLEIKSGSSCPVSRSGSSSNELSFITAVQNGFPISSAMQITGLETSGGEKSDLCVTCPHCKNQKNNRFKEGKYICGNGKCESNKKDKSKKK